MAKMSKIAKDMKNQPKLKKALATYIAENTKISDPVALLVEGHRGFLAMSEKELTKKFDEMYEEFNKRLKEEKEAMQANPLKQYGWRTADYEARIKEADDLYDALFEQLFL